MNEVEVIEEIIIISLSFQWAIMTWDKNFKKKLRIRTHKPIILFDIIVNYSHYDQEAFPIPSLLSKNKQTRNMFGSHPLKNERNPPRGFKHPPQRRI